MHRPAIQVTRTVKVIVRHSADCKDKDKGSEWRKCRCRKSLFVYEDGRDRRISAKTRSWEVAEKQAQDLCDSWDPEKQELKRLRAKAEATRVTIEEAVALYHADMIARLGDNGTVALARALLGQIDPETKAVLNKGHLFTWLTTFSGARRPAYIADVTPADLTSWRASWKFGDYTAAQRWNMVCSFFNFCEAQGWVQNNPARKLKSIPVEKGGRTAIFTDEQYATILQTIPFYEPANVSDLKIWEQRVLTFVELLRWSGMSLIDAVQYRPEQIDSDGVLRYRRQKTGQLATVNLPEHLLALLRSVPLEKDSVGSGQPFRSEDFSAHSDTITWRKRLTKLFALAGIKKVRTERGSTRVPHPSMFRDTFAVWLLRHGASIHTVARACGHGSTKTTERSYLPWVKELEQASIADQQKALAAGASKQTKGRKVVNMADRRQHANS
jgi:integrase